MTYRDEDDGAGARLLQLARDAATLRTEVAADPAPSMQAAHRSLATVEATLRQRARDVARRSLRLVDRAEVRETCSMQWEELEGELRHRYCKRCDREVWDLSELTTEEADALLRDATKPCVRLTRLSDGRVLTKDCGQRSLGPAVLAGLGAGVAGVTMTGAVAFALLPRLGGSVIEDARTDSLAVRSAAELYLAQDPHAACPTMKNLVAERILSSSTRTEDPWGNPFHIECEGDEVRVTSTGPDATASDDDIDTD